MTKTTITAPPGQPFIEFEREFDAPPDLVYRAFLEPELIVQWLGPRKYEMVIEQWDARAGGAYRYVHRDDAGNEFGFHGVCHSNDPDNMVQTFEFEGAPGHVSLDRQSIEALPGGRSRILGHSVFQSVAARDSMVENGMAEGVEDGYNRLDELLARQAQPVGATS
jgi:uncharacterized protein YndB with AHSA1/START domain